MGKQRDDVITELRKRIVNGHYVPGQLFSENDLVEDLKELSISRTPVREAFAILAQEGLIEQLPRRGVTVRFIGRAETREILQLRRTLETTVVGQLSKSNQPDRLYELETLLERMDHATAAGDLSSFLELDTEFHCQLARNAGFSTGATMLRSLRDKIRIMGLDSIEQDRDLSGANNAHRAIVQAIAANNQDLALRLVQQHLDFTSRRLLGEVTTGLPAKVNEINDLIIRARDSRRRGKRLSEVTSLLEDAVEKAQESEELHHELVQALVELSTTRRAARDFRNAEKYAIQALEVSELHGNRAGLGWANYELGRIALDDSDPAHPGDLGRLDRALELSREEDVLRGWVNYSLSLKSRRTDPVKARQHAQSALDIFRTKDDRYGMARALDLLAQLAFSQGEHDEAADLLHQSANIANQDDYPGVKADNAFHRGELTAATESGEEVARASLESALDLFVSMEDVEGVRKVREGMKRLTSTSPGASRTG